MSEHFPLHEMLRSETAERFPRLSVEQQNPPPEVVRRLEYLAETVLEPVRALRGFPLRVTSGWRCPGVNKKVGGGKRSQHLLGEAADLVPYPGGLTTFELFAEIVVALEELDIDQVIHEYGEPGAPAWVHVSASRRQDRRRITVVGHWTKAHYGLVDTRYKDLTVEQALALPDLRVA